MRRAGLPRSAPIGDHAGRKLHKDPCMTTPSLKLGFIGLGIMGTPMAGHLLKAGHKLFVHSVTSVPADVLQAGATSCKSGREVAQQAEIVFIMVPDTPHVADVLFSESGVASGLKASPGGPEGRVGKTVVDMSSISPIETKVFASQINALGCDYLDAPVSGGEVGAKNATLSIMVGGDEAVFAKVRPLFELMGKNITLVGGNGDGQTAKVANQIIVALNIEAVAEALLFAAKAGADPARVRQALMGGFASSKILEVHGDRMVKRTFDPGFRIELHQKDLNLALSSARALGVSLPNTATAQELFNACVAHGGKAWDHSAMVRALEKMANFEIGQKAG
jgi:2-hydroxy-3-oxopropionate reductase